MLNGLKCFSSLTPTVQLSLIYDSRTVQDLGYDRYTDLYLPNTWSPTLNGKFIGYGFGKLKVPRRHGIKRWCLNQEKIKITSNFDIWTEISIDYCIGFWYSNAKLSVTCSNPELAVLPQNNRFLCWTIRLCKLKSVWWLGQPISSDAHFGCRTNYGNVTVSRNGYLEQTFIKILWWNRICNVL